MLIKLRGPIGTIVVVESEQILDVYTMSQTDLRPGYTCIRYINSDKTQIVYESPAEIYAMLESGF